MLSQLKSRAVKLAGPLGGYRIAKTLTRSMPKVLMYHRFSQHQEPGKVSVATFEKQMALLSHYFNVVNLSELCERMAADQHIPSNSVALTIDDGYEDFYHYAYPILKQYQLPATLYITTDFIDQRIWLWPDSIRYLIQSTEATSVTVNEHLTVTWHSDNANSQANATHKLVQYCKSISNREKLSLIAMLQEELAISLPDKPTSDFNALNWEQVKELSQNCIEIGGHTRTHPILSQTCESELSDEISGCKAEIEKQIGKKVTSFCYPNGTRDDFNDHIKQKVKDAGYQNCTAAYFSQPAFNDLFEIKRNSVSNDVFQFKKAVFGYEHLSKLLKA